ncbi:MAG: hypothetical protein ABI443_09290 [Chthoniobacterales bacterium]
MKKSIPSKFFLFAGLLAILACGSLHAQDTAAQRQVASDESNRREVNDQANAFIRANQTGYADSSPGDSDLGEQLLLTRKEKYRPFQAYANFNEYYTNNAALSQHNMQSDFLMVPQFGLTYTPQLANNLYAELTAQTQLFRYARNSALNFNSFDAGAGLIYVVRQLGDLSFFGRYHSTLLTNPDVNSLTYSDQTLRFGVQKPFTLSRAHYVYVGSSAEVIIAGEPQYALKNDFGVFAGYQVALTRQLTGSFYYRISLFNYVQGGRDDLNQTISAGLSWNITNWFAVNAVASFAFNSSNTDNDSYWAFMSGAGVSGQLKF